jgi:hypothetical protein
MTSAFASETLKVLVNASAGFSTAMLRQLAAVQNDPTPTTLAEKTISYAKAKTAYFKALRAEFARIDEECDGQGGVASRTGHVCCGVRGRSR